MKVKTFGRVGLVALSAVLATSVLAGCADKDGTDGEWDGTYRPSPDGETTITFWGYGDENEISVFQELVKQFNELYKGQIRVNYEVKANDGYGDAAGSALRSSRAKVDVLYVGDSEFKQFAEAGYLEPLDSYLELSSEVKIEDMWETSVNRFKYDVDTTTQDGPNAHYWGIPKDIGPTVIYYNETYFNDADVTCFSVAADDLDAFNNEGAKDARGKTKAEYGIAGEVKEKGYFVDEAGNKWFNNQVAMSWDECVTLANLVQDTVRSKYNKSNAYGYFTEWWFNYGWSVGGDCIEYVPTDDAAYNGGYWDFTLMDDTPNYIVADDQTDGVTINNTHYNAGEIIEWGDKIENITADQNTDKIVRQEVIDAANAGKLNVLPSQRDAFVEFVCVGQTKGTPVDGDKVGYGICPMPTSIGNDAGKVSAFAKGEIAMLVDGRWDVVEFRKQMGETYSENPATGRGQYNWDVAPLPMYKTYDENGDIDVHGVEAGHSGSVALCMNAKSTKKNASWVFMEFIGGKTGQEAQAKSGFAIPSQKDLANSEVFLQSDKMPMNSIVFVRAAEYETPGDWWYLRDSEWIDGWAGVLNGDVRNGSKTLSQFETSAEYIRTWELLKGYTAKKSS